MSMFRVGQKVVCVEARSNNELGIPTDAAGASWKGVMDGLTFGKVYTVRALTSWRNAPALYLVEITREFSLVVNREPPWRAERFRPVAYPEQSETSDIELFLPLLTPSREIERA